ncbi:hypothetical protein O0I10_005191 [Lichtheimia ornata]|uniref:Adhesion regulating molecule n=1 Tax=Lichtheimia ornata TaxID=688661 RepID=A0AAD7Y1S8_9FUNG|nr:uncharacterized protein O0I10_005191 [Lichtheimia ornata]KAJ8659152.1 hypothetical protein O0I10_005191 [Lichtheimia ornata]
MSLFPTSQQPKHLVEFNAGKCIREGNTIKPDLRKGVVYMDQSDDQLMHFYWKERKATEPEEDLIIFPDEAEMIRVEQCTTGRVYLLKFKSSNQKLFFWMQNKSDEKDEEVISRVNHLINDPEAATATDDMSGMDMGDASADMMQLLGGSDRISRENILQFLQNAGGLGGATDSSAPNDEDTHEEHQEDTPMANAQETEQSTTEERQQQQQQTQEGVNPQAMNQLRDLLRNAQGSQSRSPPLSLNDVLTPEALNRLLDDPEVCVQLYSHLPENCEKSPEEVRQVVRSPQFQQAAATLSHAFESGDLGPLLQQLGLPAMSGGNVESFLRAIDQSTGRKDQDRNNDDAMEQD